MIKFNKLFYIRYNIKCSVNLHFPDTLLPFTLKKKRQSNTSQPGIKDPSPHLVYKIPISMSHSPTYRIVCFPKFSQGSYITHFSLPLIVRANVR